MQENVACCPALYEPLVPAGTSADVARKAAKYAAATAADEEQQLDAMEDKKREQVAQLKSAPRKRAIWGVIATLTSEIKKC